MRAVLEFIAQGDLFDLNQGIYLLYEMKSNKLARAVDDPGMIEKTLLQVDIVANRVGRRLVTSGLMAFVVVTWLTAGYLLSGPQVAAAEVDAIGAPAPLGFADIVERVKPTVVGIRDGTIYSATRFCPPPALICQFHFVRGIAALIWIK